MTSSPAPAIVAALLDRHGRTFASEAGIRLRRNQPSPLFRLLCLSVLVSARIGAGIAMSAARALADEGWTTAVKMADATWEQRTTVLNRSGYARYDESTSRYLGENATRLLEENRGDIRELRDEADGDTELLQRSLEKFTGIGPAGASFFVREVQVVWDEHAPFLDEKAADQAHRLGLPTDAHRLRRLADDTETFTRLVAGLVRSALADDSDEVLETASS